MIENALLFLEAIGFLLDKEQLPADWDSAEWQAQEPDFRSKAFFSAKVENARFLDRAQAALFDDMAKVRETITLPDGTTTTALRTSGRAHFVQQMQDFMIAEGITTEEEYRDVNPNNIRDIRSSARLRLIFDTNTRQAFGFGQWKQGMKPSILKAFPAARLIRVRGVSEPRPRHQEALGEVMLKTDPRWAEYHNAKDIGGFGVPWGPYGFRSGVSQETVSRSEARKLGLDVSKVSPNDEARITDETSASVAKMSPDVKTKLIAELRAGQKNLDAGAIGRGETVAKIVDDGDRVSLVR